MGRRKTILVLTLMVILLAAYVASTRYIDYDYISTVVATIVATVGIFGVWYQLKKDSDIKEAEFLMDYNFSFLTTEKFVRMEHRLENHFKEKATLVLAPEDRQDLVDYLVYLESLAPLILNRMIRLEVVDDLFGYRYFIAVNNPVVQQEELNPYAMYYRGCFRVYRMWSDYRKKKGLTIQLEETALIKEESKK